MFTPSHAGKEFRWEPALEGGGWRRLEIDGTEWVRFRREPGRGSLATVRSGLEEWTIKRMGCFQPLLTIRRAGETEDLAILTRTATGLGRLEFQDGRVYHWLPTRSPASEWGFSGPNGELLVRFHGQAPQCWTFVSPVARFEKDCALLAGLGLYLIQMAAADTALMTGSLIAALTTL